MQERTKKITLVLGLLFMLMLNIHAQKHTGSVDLEAVVKALESKMNATDIDSTRAAIPLLEVYMDALKHEDSREVAEQVFPAWSLVACMSGAYSLINDDKIIAFSNFIRQYYVRNQDFTGFFLAMTPVFQFYQRRQVTDSIENIAKEMLAEAERTKAKPLLMAGCLYMRAWAATARNRRFEAIDWLEKARTSSQGHTAEERYGTPFMLYVEMMGNLAQFYVSSNRASKALEVIREVEPFAAEFFPLSNLIRWNLLWLKTDCYFRMGDKTEFQRNLKLLNSLIDGVQGMTDEQREMARSTIKYMNRYVDDEHNDADIHSFEVNRLLTLQNKCELFLQNQQTDSAKVYLSDFIELIEQQSVFDILYYSNTVLSLAGIHVAERNYTEALSVMEHAMMFTKQKQIDTLSTRQMEAFYGSIYIKVGNAKEALNHLIRAKQMYELAGDQSALYYNGCLANLIDAYYVSGDIAYIKLVLDEYLDYIKSVYKKNIDDLAFQGQLLNIGSMYALLGYQNTSLYEILDFLEQHKKETDSPAWNQTKVIVAMRLMKLGEWRKAENVVNSIVGTLDKDTQQRKCMALMMCRASQHKDDTPMYQKQYNELVREHVQEMSAAFTPLERQIFWEGQTWLLAQGNNTLLHLLPDNADVRQACYDNTLYIKSMQDKKLRNVVNWHDVQGMLSSGEAAVEFVCVTTNFYDLKDMNYAALVVKPGYESPKFVPLCGVDEIISYWQDMLHTDSTVINSMYADGSSLLYDKLWQPIDSLLEEGDRVFFSVVGVLNNVNFSAISSPQHQLLGKRYEMCQLTSTEKIKEVKKASWRLPHNAVIYGGISYEETDDEMTDAALPYKDVLTNLHLTATRSLPSSRTAIGELELKGTREEALYIDKTLTAVGTNTRLLMDADANEESVKALSGQAPDVIHIGTHGFLLSTTSDQWQHRSLFEWSSIEGKREQSQMQQCGLLMSGAYRAWHDNLPPIENVEDGILTGYEVSQLDLSGCRLAVLSSCESGIGFVNVFTIDTGMKQALKLAGVSSIIVSLWEVPDDATAVLMQSLYNGIATGLTPRESLSKAQNTVRGKYPTPYNWSGFVLIDSF